MESDGNGRRYDAGRSSAKVHPDNGKMTFLKSRSFP